MRVDTTFVFQNIDGDGVPTLGGDVVALVECPKHMGRILKWSFPNHRMVRPEMNYRVAALILERAGIKVDKVSSVLVHSAQRRPDTPRRTWLVIDCEIDGIPVRILVGHAINSAWAPRWKPTTWRKRRRALWWRWYHKGADLVTEGHKDGRLVVVLTDGNRSRGDWAFPGTRKRWSHGPDAVFVSAGHKTWPLLLHKQVGPKTGDGRVTHHSLKFTLSLFRPDPE